MIVVYNPAAGGRRRALLDATLNLLRSAGREFELRPTRARGDAEATARDCHGGIVVVAGGDGTINEAVNGLLAAPGDDSTLALIPMGTANVLAAEIGLRNTPEAIARAIVNGSVTNANVGLANGRCFTAMAGVGFDAHVVAGVDLRLKRWLGKGAYILSAVRQLLSFRYPRYRVAVDGQACEAASVIVAKGHFYGGRFVCAPDARIDQPEFHVCLFPRSGRWNTLRYGVALALGRLPRLTDYQIRRGRSITIEGPIGDPVQGDGDIITRLPVTIEIAPRPIALIVPSSGAASATAA